MNKSNLLIITSILVLSISLISANPINVTITKTQYIPSPFETNFGIYSTGSQLYYELTIFSDPRYTFPQVTWNGNTGVDCLRQGYATDLSSTNFSCLFTIAPNMQGSTDLNLDIYSPDKNTLNNEILLGTYDFQGTQFPIVGCEKVNCTYDKVCTKFKQICQTNKVCASYYPDLCQTYGYHYDKTCLRYNTKGTCISYKYNKVTDGCIKYRKDLCKTYKTNTICTNTTDCLIWKQTNEKCDTICPP